MFNNLNLSIRPRARRFTALLLAVTALTTLANRASAMIIDPFFAGHSTITSVSDLDTSFYVGFSYERFQSSIFISQNGLVDDGGSYQQNGDVGNWNKFDFNLWAPLWTNGQLGPGGSITYGNPMPNVFAVSWVNLADADDSTVKNTFQIVFIGASGFHTNNGLAIMPGSVIFAYGGPSDANGTVNLSATTPAAIGFFSGGGGPGLQTLNSLGIGDTNGMITTADLTTLRNSGDPFLFNANPTGFDAPIAFTSVAEISTPEPASLCLLVSGLALLVRRPRRFA